MIHLEHGISAQSSTDDSRASVTISLLGGLLNHYIALAESQLQNSHTTLHAWVPPPRRATARALALPAATLRFMELVVALVASIGDSPRVEGRVSG